MTPGARARLIPPIECRRAAANLVTFVGATESDERVYLTLGAPAPADLPARIDAGTVEPLDGWRYRVATAEREWIIDAPRSFMHRDVTAAFKEALPPRRVPLAKRLLWRLVLSAAASRAGRWWSAR